MALPKLLWGGLVDSWGRQTSVLIFNIKVKLNMGRWVYTYPESASALFSHEKTVGGIPQ